MKDRQIKLLELQNQFRGKAAEIEIKVKQSQPVISKLATYLRSNRPTNQQESDRNDFLKEFIVRVAETNESVLEALNAFRETFQEIVNDRETVEAAQKANTIAEQSELIEFYQSQRDQRIKSIANDVRERIKGTV